MPVHDRTKARKSSGHARCIICNHVERARIELECAATRPDRAIAEDRSLLDYLGILRSELLHLFLDAKERGLTFDAGSIAARLLQTLEAIGRPNGQLRQAGVIVNNNQINGPVKTETILVSGVLAEGAKTI